MLRKLLTAVAASLLALSLAAPVASACPGADAKNKTADGNRQQDAKVAKQEATKNDKKDAKVAKRDAKVAKRDAKVAKQGDTN